MRTRAMLFTGLAAVLAVGCAAHKKSAEERPIRPPVAAAAAGDIDKGVYRAQAVQATARVQAIDHAKRVVTLRGPEGNEFEVHAGPEVKNLAQLHVGDDVVVTYYESVAITAHKPGEKEPFIETTVGVARAKPGETPGAADVQQTTAVVTVVGINHREGTVTVKGPRGRVVTVAAEDPKNLDRIVVGDLIQLVYTEALAVSVDKAPAGGGTKTTHHKKQK